MISNQEFYQLQCQLLAIQEQQQYQNYLIEQFEQQMRFYVDHLRKSNENPMSTLKQMIDELERTSSKIDSNQCVVCQRILSCQSALKMHYRTHTGERPYRCSICCRAFSTKGNLKTHMNIHRIKPGENLVNFNDDDDDEQIDLNSCRICCKRFSSSSALEIHHRTHTGERPYQCQICQRAFATKGNLKVHLGTHKF